jgi:hypothetical protein
MNWEAFFIIGGFTIILGIVLLIPGIWWARRNAKQHSESQGSMAVTKTGFIYIGLFVFILFSGFTAQFWAPDTALGNWVSTSSGRILFVVSLVIAAFVLEKILNKFGFQIRLLEKRK